jgi:hypothetical protein
MRGKGRKIPHNTIMNALLEKILTDTSAREPEEIEILAIAEDPFESWA